MEKSTHLRESKNSSKSSGSLTGVEITSLLAPRSGKGMDPLPGLAARVGFPQTRSWVIMGSKHHCEQKRDIYKGINGGFCKLKEPSW